MIAYLDTSAIVPMLIGEPASIACRAAWSTADDVVTNRLTYVESAAALASAARARRITSDEHTEGLVLLDDLWTELQIVPVDRGLVIEAATLADTLALRGYDAVHCASAARLNDPQLVVVAAGDRRLLTACSAIGLNTFDVNQ